MASSASDSKLTVRVGERNWIWVDTIFLDGVSPVIQPRASTRLHTNDGESKDAKSDERAEEEDPVEKAGRALVARIQSALQEQRGE